jgi:hypothetical protein
MRVCASGRAVGGLWVGKRITLTHPLHQLKLNAQIRMHQSAPWEVSFNIYIILKRSIAPLAV